MNNLLKPKIYLFRVQKSPIDLAYEQLQPNN